MKAIDSSQPVQRQRRLCRASILPNGSSYPERLFRTNCLNSTPWWTSSTPVCWIPTTHSKSTLVEYSSLRVVADSPHRIYEQPILKAREPGAKVEQKLLGQARNEAVRFDWPEVTAQTLIVCLQLNRITAKCILRRTSDVIANYLPPKGLSPSHVLIANRAEAMLQPNMSSSSPQPSYSVLSTKRYSDRNKPERLSPVEETVSSSLPC